MLKTRLLYFCLGFCLLICTAQCTSDDSKSAESQKIKAKNAEIGNYLEKLNGNWEFQYRISNPSGQGDNFYSGGNVSFTSLDKRYSIEFEIEYTVNYETYSYAAKFDIGFNKSNNSWNLDMSCVNWPSFKAMPIILTEDGIHGEVVSNWKTKEHTFTFKLKRLENSQWLLQLWGFMENATPAESITIVLAPQSNEPFKFLQLLKEVPEGEDVVILPEKYQSNQK